MVPGAEERQWRPASLSASCTVTQIQGSFAFPMLSASKGLFFFFFLQKEVFRYFPSGRLVI